MVFPLWWSTAVIVPSKVIVLNEYDVNLTLFVLRFFHLKDNEPRLFLVLKLSCLIVPTTWPAYFDLLFVQWISYVDLKKYFPNAGVLLTTGFGQKFLDAAFSFSKNLSLIKSSFPVGSLAVFANKTAAACVLRPHIPSATPALHPAALRSFWISMTAKRSCSSSLISGSFSSSAFFRL